MLAAFAARDNVSQGALLFCTGVFN